MRQTMHGVGHDDDGREDEKRERVSSGSEREEGGKRRRRHENEKKQIIEESTCNRLLPVHRVHRLLHCTGQPSRQARRRRPFDPELRS